MRLLELKTLNLLIQILIGYSHGIQRWGSIRACLRQQRAKLDLGISRKGRLVLDVSIPVIDAGIG